jgi:hypothetical protein
MQVYEVVVVADWARGLIRWRLFERIDVVLADAVALDCSFVCRCHRFAIYRMRRVGRSIVAFVCNCFVNAMGLRL